MSKTQHYFIPSVREGLAAAIGAAGPGAALGQRAQIDVVLTAQARIKGTQTIDSAPISQAVQLFGPGDILGFDPRIVVRRHPARDVGDFEPNYFPHIEFADADFVWRYTARPADLASGNLTPWIALVVLASESKAGVNPEFAAGQRSDRNLPPSIVVDRSALPDLRHTDRWAHVHVTGGEDLIAAENDKWRDLLGAQPERAVSRLLCARRLAPGVKYTAFVVPTFRLGVLAGLGRPLPADIDALAPAWSDADTTLELPYYYRWEFRTGLRGDFEHLVRLLEPRKLSQIGTRNVDCGSPGYGLPGVEREGVADAQKHHLGMEGGLQSLDTQYTPWGRDLAIDIPDADDIYDVKVHRTGGTTAEVSWRTRVPATSRVEFGADATYGSTVEDDSLKVEHRLSPTGLNEAGGTYHLRVVSVAESGQESYTEDRRLELPVWNEFQEKLADLLNKPNTEDQEVRHFVFAANASGSIANITGTAIPTGDKVEIRWQTASARRCRIEYGRDTYDKSLPEPEAVQDHKLTLPKLAPGKTYIFRIVAPATGSSPEDVAEGSLTMPPLPSVLPPVYGRWHRGALKEGGAILDANNQREWLDAINLDPRHRLAAGLGADIVRTQQEPLMASAWEQFGEVERVNEMLRRAQLGRDASTALHRKLEQLRPEEFLGVTAAAQKKVTRDLDDKDPGTKVTAEAYITTNSRVQRAVLDPAYRRVAGPRNGIHKRQTRRQPAGRRREVAGRLATATLEPAGEARLARGTARMQGINNRLLRPSQELGGTPMVARVAGMAAATAGTKARPDFWFDDRYLRVEDIGRAFKDANPFRKVPGDVKVPGQDVVSEAVGAWLQAEQVRPARPDPQSDKFLGDRKGEVVRKIDPQLTITERATRQLQTAGKIARRSEPQAQGDALDPVMWAPEFWQPLYEAVRDKSHDLLMPGVETVPQNTIGLLKTNRRFVESLLCGCNHEFAGELLWRGFPTDQRGTSFRQFWDVSEYVPRAAELEQLWQGWRSDNSVASTDDLPLSDKQQIVSRDIYEATVSLVAKLLAAAGVTAIEELPDEQQSAIAALRGDAYIDSRIEALSRFPIEAVNAVITSLVQDLRDLPFVVKQRTIVNRVEEAAPLLVEQLLLAAGVGTVDELPEDQRQAIELLVGDYLLADRMAALARLPIAAIDEVINVLVQSTDELTLTNKQDVFKRDMYPATDMLIDLLLREADVDRVEDLPDDLQSHIAALRGDRHIFSRVGALSQFEAVHVNDVVREMVRELDEIPFHVKQRLFLRDFDAAVELLTLTMLADAGVDDIEGFPYNEEQAIRALRDDRIDFLARIPVVSFNKVIRKLATELALKERLADITPMTAWRDGILGENRSGPTERLVLVIRGDLLKRYPNALIYAIDAVPKKCRSGEPVPGMREYLDCSDTEAEAALEGIKRIYPVFSATLPPDLTLLGFPFDREAACGCDGDPGKFFVIEERVSAPRFGLDTPAEAVPVLPPPGGGTSDDRLWDDLAWSNFGFGVSEEKFHYGKYLDTPPAIDGLDVELTRRWNEASAARRAWITWQKPVRIAIHASQMIPEKIVPGGAEQAE